jgi:EF-hand domain pair
MMTKEKIEQLFAWIDKDGSKSISQAELREMLGGGRSDKVTDNVWKELVSEIDVNGDGEVPFLLIPSFLWENRFLLMSSVKSCFAWSTWKNNPKNSDLVFNIFSFMVPYNSNKNYMFFGQIIDKFSPIFFIF